MAWWSRRFVDRPRSPWFQVIHPIAVLAPLAVCAVVAFSGPPELLPGLLVVLVFKLFRQRRYLRLSRQDKAMLTQVLMTGRASGRREVDAMARDRLAHASQYQLDRRNWLRWVPIVVFGALPVALAAAAAVVNSAWWLLLVLCTPAILYPAWRPSLPDPGSRLRTLLADEPSAT